MFNQHKWESKRFQSQTTGFGSTLFLGSLFPVHQKRPDNRKSVQNRVQIRDRWNENSKVFSYHRCLDFFVIKISYHKIRYLRGKSQLLTFFHSFFDFKEEICLKLVTMTIPLTNGAVLHMMRGVTVEKPVLQVSLFNSFFFFFFLS